MVYCGRPSRGCQVCRTRRIKCDETKPTCNQCAKARRQCPGYRDEFDLVLRNENLAAKRRALKINTGRRKNSKNSRKSSSPASSSAPTSDTASTSSSSSSSSSSPSPEAHHHPRRPASNTSTKPLPIYPLNNKQQQQRHLPIAVASIPPPISLSPEDLAPCHFLANFVLLPRHDGTRGFMEFLLPLLSSSSSSSSSSPPPPPPPPQPQTQPPTPPTRTRTLALALSPGAGEADYYHHYQELLLQQQHQEQLQLQLQQQQQRQQQRQQQQQQQDLPLRHAFNACALAWWGNRFGGGSAAGGSAAVVAAGGVVGGGGDGVLGRAFAEYARALRAVQVALRDPAGCRSDGVLAAVLLLGMFENITANRMGSLAWGSHVEGAIQLVKARGRDQLRTKLGLQLFVAVRTQLVIHTLTSGTAPAMGVDWWLEDAVVDPTAAECQRLNLATGELRAEVNRVMARVARTPENVELVQGLMRRAQALDGEVAEWMRSVPAAWRFRTIGWQSDDQGGVDYSKAEVFPGRVDGYGDFWIASLWNLARTTRLILMSLTVRCAAWVCSPLDYRTTPEYATAARTCRDTISDILASVPYHLGWHGRAEARVSGLEGPSDFACGDGQGMKGLAGYFLTWPLACVMTQDHATDAQRAYIKGRLKYIGDGLGIKYSHILSQLHVRLPSMLIRSDGLMANPDPSAHNFEKLLSSDRQATPPPKGSAGSE